MSIEPKRELKRDLTALRIDRGPEALERPRRGWRWVAFAIVIMLLAAAAIFAWNRRHELSASPVQTATAQLVSDTDAATVLTASGYVVARRQAEVGPKITGRVIWLGFDVGSKVTKGELLARLASDELAAQRSEATAALQQARLDRARQEKLLAEGIAPRASYDAAVATASIATARLRFVDEQIRHTEIRAPFDGVVTVRRADLGEVVSPAGFGASSSAQSGSLALVTDMSSLEIETDVNEANVGRLAMGMPAQVVIEAFPDRPYRGELRQIVPTADRQKGIVQVKVSIVDADKRVLPEMSARVSFLSAPPPQSPRPPRVEVPRAAVAAGEAGAYVAVVRDGRLVRQPVTLGETIGDRVVVASGLAGGETLATGEALELPVGTKVEAGK